MIRQETKLNEKSINDLANSAPTSMRNTIKSILKGNVTADNIIRGVVSLGLIYSGVSPANQSIINAILDTANRAGFNIDKYLNKTERGYTARIEALRSDRLILADFIEGRNQMLRELFNEAISRGFPENEINEQMNNILFSSDEYPTDRLLEIEIAPAKIDIMRINMIRDILREGEGTGDLTESQIEQILELCSAFNAKYIHDEGNKHFKAGMLNILLKETKGKYTVFLDYDHYITKVFLKKSIAVLEKDSDIAFVQAKVNFYNVKSKLQVWESVMYAQFFEVFERSKNNRSAVLFNGSTACFRRSVIDEIGGIPTATFTEDVDLSIQVLTKGYKSNLIEDYGSFGLVPATFSLLLSQILRWAKGSLHTLKKRWTQILFSKISFFNKLDLFFSTSLFFIASTMYLTIAIYIIMFFTKSVAIRLPISAFPPLILMPISFSVGYLISGVIAVLYAKKMGVKKMAVKDLFLFFLIALALNPFTVYAVIKSLFRVRAPTKDKDVWNEEISYLTFSFLFSLLGVGILVIAVFDFLGSATLWVVLGLIGLSLLGTFPISLYFHFSTKNNKAYLLNENNNIVE